MNKSQRKLQWTRETAHGAMVRRGGRVLAFWAKYANGQWVCIAVEGPATGLAGTMSQAMGQVFDDHSHHVLTITPRKKGARVTFVDVQRAAEAFAREWQPKKAAPCGCGTIDTSQQ